MNTPKKFPVIVRGFADEPTVLAAVGFHDGAVELAGNGQSHSTVTLGQEWVYQHSAANWRDLRGAYESGDQDKLAMAWQSIPLFNCSVLPEMEYAG